MKSSRPFVDYKGSTFLTHSVNKEPHSDKEKSKRNKNTLDWISSVVVITLFSLFDREYISHLAIWGWRTSDGSVRGEGNLSKNLPGGSVRLPQQSSLIPSYLPFSKAGNRVKPRVFSKTFYLSWAVILINLYRKQFSAVTNAFWHLIGKHNRP